MKALVIEGSIDDESRFCDQIRARGWRVDVCPDRISVLTAAGDGDARVVIASAGPGSETFARDLASISPQSSVILVSPSESIDIDPQALHCDNIVSVLSDSVSSEDLLQAMYTGYELSRGRNADRDRTSTRLLVVEDNPADVALISHQLGQSGRHYAIQSAKTVAGAVETLASEPFDAVISDLNLPDARGVDAIRRIAAAAPDVPVVVISSVEDPTITRLAIQTGASAYLMKDSLSGDILDRTLLHIVERKGLERQLFRLAHFDPLTGCGNRRFFGEHLKNAIATAQRQNQPFALLLFDLDRFKQINDSMGHAAGDALLKAMANRIQGTIRTSDRMVRLGGDEFAIVSGPLDEEGDAVRLARRVRDALSHSFQIEGVELITTASIGMSLFPADGQSGEALLSGADRAVYAAKRQGRDTYRLARECDGASTSWQALESQLRRALELGEFQLWYQPIVELKSGRVKGVEALLRWKREGRIVFPNEFIPMLESSDLILKAGRFVLEQSLTDLRRLRASGIDAEYVAVNVSVRQLERGSLVDDVKQALDTVGLPPDALEIEITERQFVQDSDRVRGCLEGLRALGVRVAMDDFGTGYSALAHLDELAVHTLKLDHRMVSPLPTSEKKRALVRGILGLAGGLDIRVVAEGIENRRQLEAVAELGCELIQGYYVMGPAPVEEALAQWNAAAKHRRESGLLELAHPATAMAL